MVTVRQGREKSLFGEVQRGLEEGPGKNPWIKFTNKNGKGLRVYKGRDDLGRSVVNPQIKWWGRGSCCAC